MKISKIWCKIHFKCYGTLCCDYRTECPIESECLQYFLYKLNQRESWGRETAQTGDDRSESDQKKEVKKRWFN